MKKIYSQPEWKIVNFVAEDVITSSGDITHTFNPDNFDNGNSDSWVW